MIEPTRSSNLRIDSMKEAGSRGSCNEVESESGITDIIDRLLVPFDESRCSVASPRPR